jgi:hypothetical protein
MNSVFLPQAISRAAPAAPAVPVLFHGPVSFWRLKRQVPNGGHKTVATCPVAFKTAAVAKARTGVVLRSGVCHFGV